MMTNAAVFESALKMPLAERYRLVEAILDSVDVPSLEAERVWALEAEDRLMAYRRGEITAKPAQELIDMLRAAL
jgi:putative addiction module component (TIGR02574 family)